MFVSTLIYFSTYSSYKLRHPSYRGISFCMHLIERVCRQICQSVCKILWITDRDTSGKGSCNLESGNGLLSRFFALTSRELTSFLVMPSSPAFFD